MIKNGQIEQEIERAMRRMKNSGMIVKPKQTQQRRERSKDVLSDSSVNISTGMLRSKSSPMKHYKSSKQSKRQNIIASKNQVDYSKQRIENQKK